MEELRDVRLELAGHWQAVRELEGLADQIELHRAVLDARLTRPAAWRGPIRRELLGAEAPAERAAVAATFDRLALEATRGSELELNMLLGVHAEAVGGGELRLRGVRVGPPSWPRIGYPTPGELPQLVVRSLERAVDGAEPPVLAAARLHLELLLIHPFADGNGRTARLASAYLLMRAGFRSTLFTAVEQHFQVDPLGYTRAFRELVGCGAGEQEPWLHAALSAMVARSALATWRRERDRVPRWSMSRWRRDHPRAAAELERQLERLRDEEETDEWERRGVIRTVRQASSIPQVEMPTASARTEPDVETAPAATVVVPAWRAADTIVRCLSGIRAQDLGEPFEVVVVSSGDDATADIVRRGFPEVRLVRSAGRLSPGAARNAGIAAARGSVVAFVAADCVPASEWLRRRVEAHRLGHDLVGGCIDSAEPSTISGWAQYLAKFWGQIGNERRSGVGRGPLFHLSYTHEALE